MALQPDDSDSSSGCESQHGEEPADEVVGGRGRWDVSECRGEGERRWHGELPLDLRAGRHISRACHDPQLPFNDNLIEIMQWNAQQFDYFTLPFPTQISNSVVQKAWQCCLKDVRAVRSVSGLL